MLRADFGARHVQAAAYGHERRHLLRPPVAVMLPSALVWLVAWALGAVALHVEPSIATAIAALASALLAAFGWRRVSVLAQRWLVFVPAGIAVHDPLMLRDTFMVNLRWAARRAAEQGCEVLIEPINTRDIAHYFLNRQADAHTVVQTVGAPNLKVQFDLYHCQIVEG
ncbi:MAG: hydroxypyruvate isomerase, partial [Actinobacteria bacterium]|nr:hydroxypyruvate isomerase [Actinomycetota bacterium]